MAYAYEDEDEIITSEEDEKEELDENLNVKKKVSRKSVGVKKVEQETNKLSIDELLATDEKGYSIDNLLKEEQDDGIPVEDLLTKKDDKLFKIYLGTGYSKITSKQFNYAALFLGPIYLLYRKVYLIGFVWLFLDLFTLFLLPIAKVKYLIIIIFEILSFICSGVFANHIILNQAGTRIVNCKMIEEDKEKLCEMVKKSGGTNLAMALVLFIIVASGVIMTFSGPIISLLTPQNNGGSPGTFNEDHVYFNGQVQADEDVKIRDNVIINVPDNFYLASEDEYRYYYVFKDPNAYMPLCSIELNKVKGYRTPELFIKAIASYHLELEENIQTMENNYLWKYINVTDSSKNIYYATTTINNDMYLLKLTYQYTLEEECGNHFEEVLNSINNT